MIKKTAYCTFCYKTFFLGYELIVKIVIVYWEKKNRHKKQYIQRGSTRDLIHSVKCKVHKDALN